MESKFRNETYLTRKMTRAAARIYHGLQKELVLGNLDAERSWNYVGDSLNAAMLIINLANQMIMWWATTKRSLFENGSIKYSLNWE